MRLTSLVIASLLLAAAPAFADGLKKTDLPAGEYEFLGNGDGTSKTTFFVVLSDGTGAIKSRNWVQKNSRFPLTALKPGQYRRVHFKTPNEVPDVDKFEILADGTLKLDSKIEDGESPFEASKELSTAPWTSF
jgi:hypothetical protein